MKINFIVTITKTNLLTYVPKQSTVMLFNLLAQGHGFTVLNVNRFFTLVIVYNKYRGNLLLLGEAISAHRSYNMYWSCNLSLWVIFQNQKCCTWGNSFLFTWWWWLLLINSSTWLASVNKQIKTRNPSRTASLPTPWQDLTIFFFLFLY